MLAKEAFPLPTFLSVLYVFRLILAFFIVDRLSEKVNEPCFTRKNAVTQ